MLNHTPKYGNDDDYADDVSRQVFDIYYNAINGRPSSKGGFFRINMLPTTCHVYFGSVTGALPDGRKAWQPVVGGDLSGARRGSAWSDGGREIRRQN